MAAKLSARPKLSIVPPPTDDAPKLEARFKAVRRLKNRINAHLDREIGRYTRAIAAAKDPHKIEINTARIEVLQKTKVLVGEL